jgi:hypothetical protein
MPQHAQKFLSDAKLATAACQIMENSYMDDVLIKCDDEESLATEVKNAEHILSLANLPTHKYVSNSTKALSEFPKEELSLKEKFSVLGTIWDPKRDLITFNVIQPPNADEKKENEVSLTKRALLSTLVRIFDSLGLLAPYTLSGKLILQKTWEEKISWDQPLTGEILEEVEIFLSELSQLSSITLPRCFLEFENSEIIELATFADASAKA